MPSFPSLNTCRTMQGATAVPRVEESAVRTSSAPDARAPTVCRLGDNLSDTSRGRLLGLLEPRVERVPQPLPEQIESEHGDEDGEAGEEREPRVRLDEGDVGLEIPAPARRRRLGAEPEKRERRLHDDGGRNPERRGHDDGRQTIRQDVTRQNG